MRLLIDGYNLIYAAGIVGPSKPGGRGLERSRAALLRFVADVLTAESKSSAVVVFDAADAPPGLPQEMFTNGVYVRFARGYADADELIEELIVADTAPRRLTVVSSDHRIQRAARRRGAKAVDSETWYLNTARRQSSSARRKSPNAGSSPEEVVKFGGHTASGPSSDNIDSDVRFWLERVVDDVGDIGRGPGGMESDDIFPPGYAEDVAEDDQE